MSPAGTPSTSRSPTDEAEERAEATRFLDAFLFRRYAAKLRYELRVWADFENATGYAQDYEELVSRASGFRYPRENYLADMDDGFYSADYLRAWIRAAQVRAYLREAIGEDWWRRPDTGVFLRDLFVQGTRPASEDVAAPDRRRPARHGRARCRARREQGRRTTGRELAPAYTVRCRWRCASRS